MGSYWVRLCGIRQAFEFFGAQSSRRHPRGVPTSHRTVRTGPYTALHETPRLIVALGVLHAENKPCCVNHALVHARCAALLIERAHTS